MRLLVECFFFCSGHWCLLLGILTWLVCALSHCQHSCRIDWTAQLVRERPWSQHRPLEFGLWSLPEWATNTSDFCSDSLAVIITSWISGELGWFFDIYLFIKRPRQTGPPMELIQRRWHQITRKWGLIVDVPAAVRLSLKLQAVCAHGWAAPSRCWVRLDGTEDETSTLCRHCV